MRKLHIVSEKKGNMTFLLPSMIEAEISRMKARHIKLFTNVGRATIGESLIDVLTSGVVIRIGKDTEITSDFINAMSPEDINALLLGLRIHSFRKEKFKKLTLSKEWKFYDSENNVTRMRRQNHIVDVGLDAFDVEYVGTEGKALYEHYAEIPSKIEIENGLFLERKNRKRLQLALQGKEVKDIDYYSVLQSQVFREDENGEKSYLTPTEFGDLDIEISETIAEIDQQLHGKVDTVLILTCGWDSSQQEEIDLMAVPAFFSPSRSQ